MAPREPKPPKPKDRPPSPRFRQAKQKEASPSRPPRNAPIIDGMAIFSEMDRGDNRTAAIVGAGLLENNLALAIMVRFRPLTPTQQKDMFDNDNSPLGSFNHKIKIGFAVNLFGERVREDLDAIRRIRNSFAHHLYVRDFDHDEVKDECDSLHFPRWDSWSTTKPETKYRRMRYLNTAAHLAERFALETRNIKRPSEPRVCSYDLVWPFP
ncbi:MAG TPA: hypothetical protein VNV38_15805 [Stellaceae bacterium]|jgi:hypothetical protein|nr:hypothetical protein [Stellaceae bacterium]